MILRFFRRNDGRENIQLLYGAIVAHSRDPAFYTDFEVPDTIEGRFEMILLHAFLLFHRLKSEDEGRRELGQRVFDAFCQDMDANLREMGVGDLTVPKKMKRVAEAFYGRVNAYDAALEAQDNELLAQALFRNVYDSKEERVPLAGALASHTRHRVAELAAVSFETLAAGEMPLPPVEPVPVKENNAS